jgi:hypothetical protein
MGSNVMIEVTEFQMHDAVRVKGALWSEAAWYITFTILE